MYILSHIGQVAGGGKWTQEKRGKEIEKRNFPLNSQWAFLTSSMWYQTTCFWDVMPYNLIWVIRISGILLRMLIVCKWINGVRRSQKSCISINDRWYSVKSVNLLRTFLQHYIFRSQRPLSGVPKYCNNVHYWNCVSQWIHCSSHFLINDPYTGLQCQYIKTLKFYFVFYAHSFGVCFRVCFAAGDVWWLGITEYNITVND
jgi:hypothetical protein